MATRLCTAPFTLVCRPSGRKVASFSGLFCLASPRQASCGGFVPGRKPVLVSTVLVREKGAHQPARSRLACVAIRQSTSEVDEACRVCVVGPVKHLSLGFSLSCFLSKGGAFLSSMAAHHCLASAELSRKMPLAAKERLFFFKKKTFMCNEVDYSGKEELGKICHRNLSCHRERQIQIFCTGTCPYALTFRMGRIHD